MGVFGKEQTWRSTMSEIDVVKFEDEEDDVDEDFEDDGDDEDSSDDESDEEE